MKHMKQFEDIYNDIRFDDEEVDDVPMDTEVEDELADNVESLIDRFGLEKVKNFIAKITR